ncbi:MAG: hypothetical protein HYT80_11875 [Euryarchaeota archaeon]|nr:hypothetical protein [Euryarchaeota archaeon]
MGPADDRRPHEAVPNPPVQGRGEVVVETGTVVVTFHLPELEPKDIEYRVGSRTVSLWSKRAGIDFRTIVVLPTWVNPGQFLVSHKNGVYEFMMEPNKPSPALAA